MSIFTLDEIFSKSLNSEPYRHQKEAAKAILEGNSVVIRAPCGSGKTEACLLPYLVGRKEKLPSRLIYSLPTRALADDIVERMKNVVADIGIDVKTEVQHGANSKDRFFRAELIVATIDQTVGAYCSTPLSLPAHLGNIPAGAATSSMLCFDEAHTYDYLLGLQAMLVLIKRAQHLGLPCIVMSATIPDKFIDYFVKKGFVVIEGRDEDIKKRRERKVFLYWTGKFLQAEDVLKKAINGKRVIVVCNTVDRAQKLLSELENKISPLFLLHSRFLPEDRKRLETEMKKHFKNGKPGCLISTQVCQVGLDISCDVMLTEIAPPDDIIQRLGRCAREGREGEVYVYDIENSAPYNDEIVKKCRTYVITKWHGQRIGWYEELNLVNTLLSDKFGQVLESEHQWVILNNLADASFNGDKNRVERSVRDILNVNLTIHEDPISLGNEIQKMPWFSIDVRLLQKEHSRGVRLWLLKWHHDENGLFSPEIEQAVKIEPYESYIIHPKFAYYDDIYGLVFGKSGHSLYPVEPPPREKFYNDYRQETWIEHAINSLRAFDIIRDEEIGAIRLLAKLLGFNEKSTYGIIAYAVGLHDIGKLSVNWQKAVGAGATPLAHVPCYRYKPPPHATISGYALQEAFGNLIPSEFLLSAIVLAIGHHHHTRAEEVKKYDFILNWRELVEEVCKN
ncbi:MAG: CRISPR-associated helicase Cas3', partial [Candidatus Bathyarchaeia archaeon]